MSNKNTNTPTRWQSLEELAGSPSFLEFIENEFPQANLLYRNSVDRRQFLTLMAASFGLGGLTACTPTDSEKIVPYVRPPEEAIPGKPLYFATTMPVRGYGVGLLAESHQGRPTKVEGNPQHSASLGATDAYAQASVLTLYDPDRSQSLRHDGSTSTWEAFADVVAAEMKEKQAGKGKGLHVLTETVTSPTLSAQIDRLLKAYPAAKWHQYEPTSFDSEHDAAKKLFGRAVTTSYDFEKASVVVSLDADFLTTIPGNLRYTKQFTRRRRPPSGGAAMNRLYVLESAPSLTGAMADHKVAVRSSDIPALARAIQLGVENKPFEVNVSGANRQWIEAVVKDLRSHRGDSLVIVGGWQPVEVHILAHLINAALGNVNQTVLYDSPVEPVPVAHMASLRELVTAMAAREVDTLVILGGNPVYGTPADLEFRKHLQNVGLRIHLSMYDDETSEACNWHIPEAHYLEAWGDLRAFDANPSIIQPLIDPLYGGKTASEVVSALLGEPKQTAYEIVQSHWQQSFQADTDFQTWWRGRLHDGFIGIPIPPNRPGPARLGSSDVEVPPAPAGMEVVFRPDPTVFDGRFANNSWLQELPKALSKVSWDNVVQMSPATAAQLGLDNTMVIELQHEGRSVKGPVWIMPGHADQSVTVFLGYGRTRAGTVGTGRGYNAYAIRTSDAPWIAHGVEIRKTSETYKVGSTQHHYAMEDRHTVRTTTLADYAKNPAGAQPSNRPSGGMTLYPEHASEDYAWGMSIDLSACIGCNACVIACQSENNIPVVGKEEVLRSREMHWIRVDRYYEGSPANPGTLFQPMFCQHCENAPCEPVCPVGATTHSAEGLNEMTYNRCVGTRYCSNNCPYKVRRFNFFQYAITEVPSLRLLDNPDVTVRSRGVMEKCTYCVQRINVARITAKNEDRMIRDGEVVSACQSVCPADAIVFGNIKDAESRVSKLKSSPRDYGVLEELNTRPRTTYLAKVTNPNPELVEP